MIVGICGLSGSGKDAAGEMMVKNHGYVRVAFADIMKRICMEVFDFTEEQLWGDGKNVSDERYVRTYDETRLSDENPVDLAPIHLTPRLALQKLGSWGRECYPDVWAEHTLRVAREMLCVDHLWYTRAEGLVPRVEQCPQGEFERDGVYPVKGVVVTDVRFKNEIAAIKQAGGFVVRISRPGYDKPKWDHPSETEQLEVPDEEFNGLIFNDKGLPELEREVRILAEVLK